MELATARLIGTLNSYLVLERKLGVW